METLAFTLKSGKAAERTGSLARFLILVALCTACAIAAASTGSIQLTAFPGVSVADGRSTITVSAEVRDNSGNLVPDGTQVVFETTLGTFRETVVTTQNGFARAILVAGSIPGEAKVRAGALKFGAMASLDLLFVADRSLLSSANDYVEVVAPRAMAYSLEEKVLQANGEDRGVHLRYKDIVIDADDIELIVPNYEVRARNARLTMGEKTWEVDRLFMRLNQRKGSAYVTVREPFYRFSRSWIIAVPIEGERERQVSMELVPTGMKPLEVMMPAAQYEFKDISLSLTIIEAKKAVAYPARQVDFYRANVIVGEQSIMKVPLFRASTQPQSPIITEQFVNVSNNDLAINYPYYLDLRPGQMSLLRLRYGSSVGSGVGRTGGTYLDYEFNWNQGADMDGGLRVSGLARKDWGVGMRQMWRPSPTTTFSAQLDFPAHRSMFANVNLSNDFDGFNANLNASHGQSIEGMRFRNNQYSMIIEKDPIYISNVARLFLGVNGQQTNFISPTTDTTQQRLGMRARFIGNSMRLGSGQSLNLSYVVGHYSGTHLTSPFTHQATMSLTTAFRNGLYLQTNYDYVLDGITDAALGQHRLSSEAYYSQGAYSLHGFVAKSLDVQRLNASVQLNYRASTLWRINYGYYLDQYIGDTYLDQTVILAYRIGFREIGLSYSARRNRLGLEILGTTFN